MPRKRGRGRARLRKGATAALDDDRVAWAVAHASVQAAEDLGVAAIVCPTQSGTTARRVAAFRPAVPIAGISAQPDVLGRLCLVWGVRPLTAAAVEGEDGLRLAVKSARDCRPAHTADLTATGSASPGQPAGAP